MSLEKAVVTARLMAALTAGAHLKDNPYEAADIPMEAADAAIAHLEDLTMEFRALFGNSWRDTLLQLLDGLEGSEAA